MRAFMFPGQGSQYVGMGRLLAKRYVVASDTFAEADEVLGSPLSDRIWHGEAETLKRTTLCQPALLCVEVATLRVLAERGERPDALIGHSLGEYAAVVAAGAMTFADALETVAERARLMEEAVPTGKGAMAAVVGPDARMVGSLIERVDPEHGVLEIAVRNAPNQTAVAGTREAVVALCELTDEEGISTVLLDTAGPFHCSLLREAGSQLAVRLAGLPLENPRIPYVANVDAAWVRRREEIAPKLVAQVSQPVCFEAGVRSLINAGVTSFVEVGPGRTLRGLVRRVDRKARVQVTDAGRNEAQLNLAA